MTTLICNFKTILEVDDAPPYLTMEVVLYLMQKVIELVQTLTRYLAVECAIRANISYSDICVHGINLEGTKDTSRVLKNQAWLLPT